MGKGKLQLFAILSLLSIPAYADVWVNHHSDSFDQVTPVNYNGTVDIVNDPTSPDATSGVWRFTYLKNTAVGSGIAACFFGVPPNTNELWIQYYYKFSPGFVYQDIATKHGYLYTEGSDSSNFMFAMGNKSYGYGITPQGSNFANYPPNISGSVGGDTRWYFNAGVWHKVKLYFKFNNGSSWDGKYKAWIDDVQIAEYSNVMYDSGYSGWRAGGIYPIWGGGAGNTVPQTQYLYVDGLYVGSTDPGGNKVLPSNKIPSYPIKILIN